MAAAWLIALTMQMWAQVPASNTAPSYTADGIVNAATGDAGILAPNMIASLYGTNLAWNTHPVTAGDLDGGTLPISLEGVSVFVDAIRTNLFYVSPGQINFLIPYEIVQPTVPVFVSRQGIVGPEVTIQLAIASPGLFQWNGNFALAEHADGTLISASAPARPGEVVVLYADGLGRTTPDVSSGYIASTAFSLRYLSELEILLNGSPCPPADIYYAGLTPGYAGLYQINLRLPDTLPANLQIQVALGGQTSPAGVQLLAE